MAWACIVAYLLCVTPLRFGAAAQWQAGELPQAALGLTIWGVRLGRRFALRRDETGRLYLEGDGVRALAAPSGPALKRPLRALRALGRANHARALLRRGVQKEALLLETAVRCPDAGQTALLTGLLRALGAAQPLLDIRALPAFRGGGGLRFRCIARARLGTLLLVCALGAVSYLRAGKKEEKPWIIPSGT